MSKVVFYCRDTLDNIGSMEYYQQDIAALRALGHEVIICNRYRDIPLKFDLMFIWWWTYALYPTLLALTLRKPCLITGVYNFRHSNIQYSNDYLNRRLYQKLLIKSATYLSTLNLFVSKNEFIEVTNYFNLDNSEYYPCTIADNYFLTDRKNDGNVIITNISWSGKGNLERKGVFDIIKSAALLSEDNKSLYFTLAGRSGDGFDLLKAKVEESGVTSFVSIRPDLTYDEKIELYNKSTIYLQPSYYEGFGLATAEAMACGCCVITCDVGEVRNVVGDEALYVKPGNPEEIAQAIKLLITNPERRKSLSERGQKRMKELFSFETKIQRLKHILGRYGIS